MLSCWISAASSVVIDSGAGTCWIAGSVTVAPNSRCNLHPHPGNQVFTEVWIGNFQRHAQCQRCLRVVLRAQPEPTAGTAAPTIISISGWNA